MANTVRISPVNNMDGYTEFDYKNPTAKKRVRRKILANNCQADLIKSLLEQIMDNNWNFDNAVNYIRTNNFYQKDASYYEDSIQLLYFNYCDKNTIPNEVEREEQKNKLLDAIFPLDAYKANFCFLGKAGVGKSTLIKKMSRFWDKKDVSFPFTDTSRTSTFPADYCFVPKTENFKFAVTFIPQSVINLNISECIDRGVNKLLELKNNNEYNEFTSINDVMVSFISDPAQAFDIRYSVGKYIKTTSPAYKDSKNEELISFWNDLYQAFNRISIEVINADSSHEHQETSYYQLKYTDAIKQNDDNNSIKKLYLRIINLIQERMLATQTDLILSLKNNDAICDIDFDMKNETVPYFTCNIRYQDGEAFYKFIRAFTTKKASEFGNSFFNIVDHLRIELPTNDNIVLPQKGYSFVIQDTIGIAHSNDGNGGFENSTRLKMENVDAVVLIDDSRMNGDNNVSVILSHLLARISPYKVYFAFTFFNDLKKEDFDEEDDIDTQRISYLITTEAHTIRNIVNDSEQTKILLNKLNSNDSFFMKNLMDNDYDSINSLLKTLIQQKMRLLNSFKLFKPDPDKPFVIYDYKKLPLLYQQAITEFSEQQNYIYQVAPPHYKTTEALTNRLSQGISFFSGARILRPLDDLYDLIIQSLSEFIDKPAKLNFDAADSKDTEVILGQLKTLITESIRVSLNAKFFSKSSIIEWKKLYYLSGIGCDKIRRSGIIKTESDIAPGLDEYLNSTVNEHIIDVIEESFITSIKKLEHHLELDN